MKQQKLTFRSDYEAQVARSREEEVDNCDSNNLHGANLSLSTIPQIKAFCVLRIIDRCRKKCSQLHAGLSRVLKAIRKMLMSNKSQVSLVCHMDDLHVFTFILKTRWEGTAHISCVAFDEINNRAEKRVGEIKIILRKWSVYPFNLMGLVCVGKPIRHLFNKTLRFPASDSCC